MSASPTAAGVGLLAFLGRAAVAAPLETAAATVAAFAGVACAAGDMATIPVSSPRHPRHVAGVAMSQSLQVRAGSGAATWPVAVRMIRGIRRPMASIMTATKVGHQSITTRSGRSPRSMNAEMHLADPGRGRVDLVRDRPEGHQLLLRPGQLGVEPLALVRRGPVRGRRAQGRQRGAEVLLAVPA